MADLNVSKSESITTSENVQIGLTVPSGKSYIYKVYDSTGATLIKTWTDVVSELNFSQEINSAGSQVTVHLARPADNFGEGTDIIFNNQVKIYVVDNESINGVLLFVGFIDNYSPIYGDREVVEVVIMGYGFELDKYLIEGNQTIADQSQAIFTNDEAQISRGFRAGQTFIVGSGVTNLSAIKLYLRPLTSASQSVTVTLYASVNGSPLASVTQAVTGYLVQADWTFTFSSPIPVIPGAVYFFTVCGDVNTDTLDVGASDIEYYANGAAYMEINPDQWATGFIDLTLYDLVFTTYYSSGPTTFIFTAEDPSDILRDIIDQYQTNGGTLGYSASSIDDTGTTVNYTFNTNTVLEGINKCLELAPKDWYWYIDQSTNLIHFHRKANTQDFTLVLGKSLVSFQAEKRSEDIINKVYFTGNNLYEVFTNETSIAAYGVRSIRYNDLRVSLTTTARIIADTYLAHASPEVRITAEIADSNSSRNTGFDIESMSVGKLIAFRGFGNSDTSLWDVAQWDVSYWDYNVSQIETILSQVTRVEYAPSSIKIISTSLPPDVNKRVEDVNRNLVLSQTANNASEPT